MAHADLTRGPVVRGIIAFALPLLFTSVVQQLYSTIDLLFVGNVLGTQAAAALGVGVMLVNILVALFTGLSTGSNVHVAHLFGTGDARELAKGVASALACGVFCGMLLGVAAFVFAPAFIGAMETPDAAVADAVAYLRVYSIAIVAVAVYNMAAGVLRAVGDSATPFRAQVAGGLLNVAANWFILCVLGCGVAGVALATLLSNALAAAVALRGVHRCCGGLAAFDLRCAGWGHVRGIVSVGAPVAIQTTVITLSNVVVQHQIDLLGMAAIAAFSAYFKVELPIYYAILAFGQATTTFVAQNHGAHDHERARKGAWVCQGLGLGVSAALSAIMLAVGPWAFWVFNQDEAVIASGVAIISITFPLYFLYSILEVQADAIRGLGHSLQPALIVLANVGVLRLALVLLFCAHGVSIEAIASTYPITWATTALCMVACRVHVERRHHHRLLVPLSR